MHELERHACTIVYAAVLGASTYRRGDDMKKNKFEVEWIDLGTEPQCQPDPNYPKGKDVVPDMPADAKACTVKLPYPAKRCGVYVISCSVCALRVGVTTAGRADDPRSIKVPCKPLLH
jgi:ferredoxin